MKHFFDQSTVLDEAAKTQLLLTARKELRSKPMRLDEMSTKMDLICINGSTANQYVPRGMESLITLKNMPLNQTISPGFSSDLAELIENSPGDVFAYVLENIHEKNVNNYFDIVFSLKTEFKFEPWLVAHFSYQELIRYLTDFLNATVVDNINRHLEIFDEKLSKPWKTIKKVSELETVDKGIREPIILDRPFFSDINLNVVKGPLTKVVKTSLGQIKSVQNQFNRYQTPSGEIIRSKNKLFFKWKDIAGFKMGSVQSNSLLGISYQGKFIPSSQFITHAIGLNIIKIEKVDFFRFFAERKSIEIKPEELVNMEINLDTQQMILTRGIGENEFHVGRFNKLKLYKEEKCMTIHRVIPFNRGASNFDMIQKFLATRYTEYEKARNILNDRGEFGLLSSRRITASDSISHLVLSCMQLLDFLPFETHCIGFEPEDVQNPQKITKFFKEWFEELRLVFVDILDVSKTPSFTDHNFNRLTKNIQAFIKQKDSTKVTSESLEKIIEELENLTHYMDDFFKLNIYSSLQDDLECETLPQEEEESDTDQSQGEQKDVRLDSDTKSFISENFSFFEKRGLVQSAIIRIEKMFFYNKYIKPFSDDLKFEPDLIVYSDSQSQLDNYLYASYPALSLSDVLDVKTLKKNNEEEELFFLKFIREFIKKTFQKAQELNKSFLHQYKHTLAELSFVADEKLRQLQEELKFLEIPENREQAYSQLLEKITQLYHQHLREKKQNIENLTKESAEVKQKTAQYKKSLEKFLDISIEDGELETVLKTMPDRLEKMKQEILQDHKKKLAETSAIFNAFAKFHNSSSGYFKKILNYIDLFMKALWIHRYQQLLQKVKQKSTMLFALSAEDLEKKIRKLKEFQYQKTEESAKQKEIDEHIQKLKSVLLEFNKISSKGLFQKKIKTMRNLNEYLTYYKDETVKLTDSIAKLHPIYQQLSESQNILFKKQEELVLIKLKKTSNELQLRLAGMILNDPNCQEEIENLEQQAEKVPKEIKDELSNFRARLVDALTKFKSDTASKKLGKILDYKELFEAAERRNQTNDVAKELVNFIQGVKAIEKEKEGEIKDLEYMKAQEDKLEEIAMSKTLPSTRILLKTQYIPLVEKEKKVLAQTNQLLSEIISNEKAIKKSLVSTFFKKRFGLHQFTFGSYCLDISRGTKDHTEKNIYSAYLLLAERFPQACAQARTGTKKIGLNKLEIDGLENLRTIISQIWHGHKNDRFLYLPSSLSLADALELCEYKDMIAKNNPKPQKSRNSLILIYVHQFSYDEIQNNKKLLNSYNKAILSNIFVNVDGQKIFNNRDSIFDACVRETFGNCSDQISGQVVQNFIY